MHWRRKWQPTPVFLPGEPQGRGSLVGCRLWGGTESDATEATQQQQQQGIHYMCCTQLWPTLCNPVDCKPPAPSVHRIFRQEYWSRLPFPSLGNLPNPGTEPAFSRISCTADGSFTAEPSGKVHLICCTSLEFGINLEKEGRGEAGVRDRKSRYNIGFISDEADGRKWF